MQLLSRPADQQRQHFAGVQALNADGLSRIVGIRLGMAVYFQLGGMNRLAIRRISDDRNLRRG